MSKKKASAIEDRAYLDNAVSTLVANIRFAAVDSEIRSICLTSSIPNEGKSTISCALAESLASQGKRVLLVENDLHRRTLAGMLGVHARTGLYAVLVGQAALQDAVVSTKANGLYFLDCEPHIPNPANVLSSKRFRSFVEAAERAYDYVVFDTPPVSTFVDGAVVGSICDATLLVVRNNFARRDDVVASMEQLRKADANVIGTVLNFVENERNDYYYDYYTKEGKKVRSSKGSSGASAPVQQVQTGGAAATPSAGTGQTAVPRTARAASQQAQQQTVGAAQPQAQQAATVGVQPVRTAASARRKVAPDSTEQFMINAGYTKGTGSKS